MLGTRWIAAGTVLLASIGWAMAQQADFTGHRVVRVRLGNAAEVDRLMTMTDDVWSHTMVDNTLDVRVSPQQYDQLAASELPFEVLIPDVQAAINASRPGAGDGGPYTDYMPYADVMNYLEVDLIQLDQHGIASVVTVGQSLEGRDIKGLRITGPGGGTKPGVFYHACQHAREWITVPVATYFAEQLIRGYNNNDPAIVELVNRAEFYVVPIFNPDGYSYTWTNNRMWRKNRRDNGNGTFGVDLNRNWSVGWGGPGSSGSGNSDTYRGTAPFSEPETTAVSNFIAARPNIMTMNDIHSYGQLILLPYGTSPALPDNQGEYLYTGFRQQDIIQQVHGRLYTVGNCYSHLYPASGIACDWGHEAQGLLGNSFELRDTGQSGFLLPPEQILPTAEEIFPSLLFQAEWATAPVRIAPTAEGLPDLVDPAGGQTLQFEVYPAAQNVDPNGVTLWVRGAGEPGFTPYPAVDLGGDRFEAEFPAVSCDGPVEYYATALGDGGGMVAIPRGAPLETFTATPGILVVTLYDNFETNNGWTAENLGAVSGDFERGVPVNDPNWEYDPASDSDGSGQCWLTQNQLGNTDVDDGAVRITSPLLDLSAPGVVIQYDYFLFLTNENGADALALEVSSDGGVAPWTTVVRHTSNGGLGWRTARIDEAMLRANGVTPTAAMRLRFNANDANPQSIVEGGLDAFTILHVECGASFAIGDLNCDGAIDAFDIEPFIAALTDPNGYNAMWPDCDRNLADVNGDGVIDAFDIEAFINLLVGP